LKEIFIRGFAGRTPEVPTESGALKAKARAVMTEEGFAYAAGGAGEERTVAANRTAFDRWRIRPRVLRGVETRDLSVRLFGRERPMPLVLSPVGVLDMAHREADLAVARAAAALGVPFATSSQASFSMEASARAGGADAPRWFQLYWNRSRAIVESFVRRAERAGYEAIVLTVDTPTLAWRPRDLDLGYLPFLRGRGLAQYTSDPVFVKELGGVSLDDDGPSPPTTPTTLWRLLELMRRAPGSTLSNLRSGRPRKIVQHFIASFPHAFLSWDDLAWLCGRTDLPVLVKGILHPDDARRVVEEGADGVWVSNHGGRQIDGGIAALDALPDVVAAVGNRVPVLMDGGVRTGSDVLKALALGATAVGIGRPYVYGLAIAGADGVHDVVRNLVADLDLTMTVAGCGAITELGRDMLRVEGGMRDSTEATGIEDPGA